MFIFIKQVVLPLLELVHSRNFWVKNVGVFKNLLSKSFNFFKKYNSFYKLLNQVSFYENQKLIFLTIILYKNI